MQNPPMDWIQFWTLMLGIVGTLLVPMLLGLIWLIFTLTGLRSSIRELRNEIHSAQLERRKDRRRVARLRQEMIQVRSHLNLPKPGSIITGPQTSS